MSELYVPHELKTGPKLTRRALLLALAGGAIEMTCHASEANNTTILPEKDTSVRLADAKETGLGSWPLERIDRSSIGRLISDLQLNRGNPESRLDAVLQSLRGMRLNTPTGETQSTGFQIDTSGIYFTAKHVLPTSSNEVLSVVDPYSGEEVLAKGFVVHDHSDMALVYAPTGKPASIATGLQLDLTSLAIDERLWLVGLYKEADGALYRLTKFGRVQDSVRFPARSLNGQPYADAAAQVAVQGLIPYGGTSGSPIINESGVVVGIESGAYPDNATSVNQYDGARICPITYAASLDSQAIRYA